MTGHEGRAPQPGQSEPADNSAVVDHALLARFVAGNANAFETLWKRHEKRLRRLCLYLMNGRRDDAEGTLSDARFNALTGLAGYAEGDCNVAALVTKFTTNACYDALRKAAHETTAGVDLIEQQPDHAPAASPINVIVRQEEEAAYRRRVSGLSRTLREPLIMRELLGMDVPEIAKVLGIAPHTVSQRIYKAHTMLNEQPPPERKLHDIEAQMAEVRLISLTLPSGCAVSCRVHLNKRIPLRPVRVETLRKYVAKHPSGWVKRLELANQLLVAGQLVEALAEFRRVAKDQPQHLEVWLRIGEILRGQQRMNEARCVYEKALDHAISVAGQEHIRGWIALCSGAVDGALEAFHRAAALEPENPAHLHAIGFTARDAQRSVESADAFERALALNAGDVVALTGSHDALQHLGRDAEIIPRLERALATAPNDVLTLKLLAVHRTVQGRVWGSEGQRTLALIRRAVRLAPDTSEVWEPLQHFYDGRAERDTAEAVWTSYLELHPRDSRAWRLLAGELAGSGFHDRAVDAARRAAVLAPNDQLAQMTLCGLLGETGKLPEARAAVEVLVQRFPDRWESWSCAGRNLAGYLGDPNRGCDYARRATELEPALPAAWREYGCTLFAAHRFEDADAAWNRTWELTPCPRQPDRTLAIAEAWTLPGREPLLHKWLTRALGDADDWRRVCPGLAEHYRGLALDGLGQSEAAIAAYRAGLASGQLPRSPQQEAQERLRRLVGVGLGKRKRNARELNVR